MSAPPSSAPPADRAHRPRRRPGPGRDRRQRPRHPPRQPPPTSWSRSTPPSRSAGAPASGSNLLAIVVRRHYGDLRFIPAPGDTRFQVLLPLTQNG